MAETLTYADRVKTQWNNDVAEEYSNHCEVTIQLTNDSKREDIYKMLKESKISFDYIEGIIQKPGNMVNITLDRKNNAMRLADILRKRPEVNYAIAHGDDRIDLTIRWVPIRYPQRHLDDPAAPRNPRPSSTGCRQVWHKRRKKDIQSQQEDDGAAPTPIVPIPGKTEMCECPNRIQPSTDKTTKQDLPKTPTRALDADDEKPATHPNESSIVNSAAAETKELRRGAERESAKDAEKSRPTTENPQENSREPTPMSDPRSESTARAEETREKT
ncbi:unnamed protein product [Clavelina lepadiformis]|uniref:Uncharacterized protein n=1 Tax=Clavelina lepadiformis TaxID=159417 RepID=A0ABP0FCP8_CLALP